MIGVVVFTSRIWTDLRSHDLYLPSPRLHAALVFLLPSSYPPPLLISFCSPWGLLLFPRTVRRYHKDQITMVTISHIVIAHTLVWWLFLFWTVGGCCPYLTGGAPSNLFWCRRNNVAIYWIHAFAQSERRWITSNAPVMTHHSQSHGKEDRLNCMSQSYSSSLKRIHVHRGSALERSTPTTGLLPLKAAGMKTWQTHISTDIYRYVNIYAQVFIHTLIYTICP